MRVSEIRSYQRPPLLQPSVFSATTSDDRLSLLLSLVPDMWILESDGDLLAGISK